jgi:hypothetical protein
MHASKMNGMTIFEITQLKWGHGDDSRLKL